MRASILVVLIEKQCCRFKPKRVAPSFSRNGMLLFVIVEQPDKDRTCRFDCIPRDREKTPESEIVHFETSRSFSNGQLFARAVKLASVIFWQPSRLSISIVEPCNRDRANTVSSVKFEHSLRLTLMSPPLQHSRRGRRPASVIPQRPLRSK